MQIKNEIERIKYSLNNNFLRLIFFIGVDFFFWKFVLDFWITHLIAILLLIKVSFGIVSPYSESLIFEDEPINILKTNIWKILLEDNELTI